MPKKKVVQQAEIDGMKTLPHNRKEVFFDLLAHRKTMMFAISSLTFLFFVPLIIDLFFFHYLEIMAISNNKDEQLFSLIFYSMIIMLPCMLLGFIGLGGAFYIAKKMVFQEMVFTTNDFFIGIKENWKHSLINGAIFGIVLFGLIIGGSFLIIYAPIQQVLCGIGIGALVVVFITIGIMLALTFTQDVYYSNSYGHTLKNSFSFLGLLNWKVLLLFVFTTGVVVGLSCINLITLTIGIVLFAILNYVVVILYTLLSHSAFDKYINKEHYPEMVGKGLYKEEKRDVSSEDKEA